MDKKPVISYIVLNDQIFFLFKKQRRTCKENFRTQKVACQINVHFLQVQVDQPICLTVF